MATSRSTAKTLAAAGLAAGTAAAAASEVADAVAVGSLPPALKITAKRESYYAGGQTTPFTFESRVVPTTNFTKAQLEDLMNDPYVVVEPSELPQETEEPKP